MIITFILHLGSAWGEWMQSGDLFALLEKKYGFMDLASDPKLAQIQNIFNRVQDAADKRGNRMPQLKVVNQPEHPWAIALPDGTILLSLGAIHLCYRNVSQKEGDTRMAFVLGHELAHLAKNDFWDTDLYQAIAGSGKPAKTRPQPKSDKGEAMDPPKKPASMPKEGEAMDPPKKPASMPKEGEAMDPP
ncbi:MAG: M48 family metalloprotease, partial [Magnetococcus sp. YQC-5]